MPRIKLTEGYFRYKGIPVFEGVKRIDKEKAFENLCALKKVLDKYGIEFQLTYGTLLGAIREKDFIEHDEDIDLLVFDEEKQHFFDILPHLKNVGFDVARYDRRNLMSIIRNGEYIDIYFMALREDGTRYCGGNIIPTELTEKSIDYDFKGLTVKIPQNYIDFLRYEYGEDWMTPVEWFDFEPSRFNRLLTVAKTKIKEWLPDCLYFYLIKPSEKRLQNKYFPKLEKFRKEQQEKQRHV